MHTPDTIAGRFCIECEIGRGGMGTVYRASHLGLERPVAVKILKPEFAANPEVAERFMREACTMAKLRHPRAAMIFDAGRLDDGRPFIVMEYVEGVTLAETLVREHRLTPARAVRIASEICEVLAEAHGLGIVHRDLKPSNIMLTERGVCVLDFGIAKVLSDAADTTRTHATTESGLIIGTPRYMSPEQCMGRGVGARSDLYSVGVLVYEMLAGRPPFTDQMSSAVLVKQATAAPPSLLALCPDVPRSLALAVHTLLAKNPINRPKRAADARALLETSLAPSRISAEALRPAPFTATIAALDANRSVLFFRAAAAFVTTVMLGWLLLAWSHGGSSAQGSATRSDVSTVRAAVVGTPPRPTPVPALLSLDEAFRIASSVSPRGKVSDARVMRVGNGQVIAAVLDQPREKAMYLHIVERRGRDFRVTKRVPLDVDNFRGVNWTADVEDIDGDGYDEVVCSGEETRPGDVPNQRFVLYVPRTRQLYTLRVAPERRPSNTVHATWSANALYDDARRYRHALRQRAFATSRTL